MKPALSDEPMTREMPFFRTAGKSSFTALAWSAGENCRAQRQTSGSASSITFRMGSGVFTPMPQARMMPSSRIFDSAGKAPLPGDLVLLLPAVREIGEVRGNVVHERDVQAVHAEALQAVLDRAAHAVRRVVEHD